MGKITFFHFPDAARHCAWSVPCGCPICGNLYTIHDSTVGLLPRRQNPLPQIGKENKTCLKPPTKWFMMNGD